MHFIKQVTQDGDPTEFIMTPTREIKQLRKTQAKLSSQLANVQTEYEFVWKEKERIEQEYTEMKLTNTDLENKLVKDVEKPTLTPDLIILELEGKLSEKERSEQRLKEELTELKKVHETSVNAYRDELDVLSLKIDSLSQAEQTAQVMRLTVEELKPLREQLRLSMEENESLQRKVGKFEEEETSYQSTVKQVNQLKDQLTVEKTKRLQLEAELSQRENHIKSLLKDNLELVEKLQVLESKNRELVLRLDQLQTESNAEDSFAIGTPLREIGEISVLRSDGQTLITEESGDPKVVRALDFWASDKSMKGMKEIVTLANENRDLRMEKESLTDELSTLRKTRDIERSATEAEIASIKEAFRREIQVLQESAADAETTARVAVRDLTEEITHLTASVKALEMINRALMEEAEGLKSERSTHWDELAQLYKEKDEMSARFIGSRDETLRLNTDLAEKMVKISQLEHEIAQLKTPKQPEVTESETQKALELVESGRKISELRLRISELESAIKQKEIIEGQAETKVKHLQDRYHHAKSRSLHQQSKIAHLSRTKEELQSLLAKERDTFQSVTFEMVKTMTELQGLVEVKTLMS